MIREVREIHDFTREEVHAILKSVAKMAIVGGMYIGDFAGQSVEEMDDGSFRVITLHQPAIETTIRRFRS
jgi:hypothetical protein